MERRTNHQESKPRGYVTPSSAEPRRDPAHDSDRSRHVDSERPPNCNIGDEKVSETGTTIYNQVVHHHGKRESLLPWLIFNSIRFGRTLTATRFCKSLQIISRHIHDFVIVLTLIGLPVCTNHCCIVYFSVPIDISCHSWFTYCLLIVCRWQKLMTQ